MTTSNDCGSGNTMLTMTLFGVIFGLIHFFGREEEKHQKEILIMKRKIEDIRLLCKEMKDKIDKIQEQEKTAKMFITLSDLAHKKSENNDGVDYEDCIEQYIEQCSVEQFIDIEEPKEMEIQESSDANSQRNRSNSLSSILGTAKKIVFG
jgi:hypothetical protein